MDPLYFDSCSRMCCLVSTYLWMFSFSCCYWLLASFCFGQKKYLGWFFLSSLRLVLWPNMGFILGNVPCVLENMYVEYMESSVCLLKPFGLQCCSVLLFPYWLSVQMICPLQNAVLMFPANTVLLCISPLRSVSICFI